MKCDKKEDIKLIKVEEDEICHKELYFNSKYACPHDIILDRAHTFIWILIFLAVLVSIYFGAIMLFNMILKGKLPGESIPHLKFWLKIIDFFNRMARKFKHFIKDLSKRK